MTISLPHH